MASSKVDVMKHDNAELCAALLTIGSGNPAVDYIRSETFTRLSDLGLIQFDQQWMLTAAGRLLLPSLEAGDSLPNLAN